ncbi:MAG: virulence factor [Geminicoccaceae bacterium]
MSRRRSVGGGPPHLVIVSWRDIPAQIVATGPEGSIKRELDGRFQRAIDACAMRTDARDDESYLADWKRSEPVRIDGDLSAAVDAEQARLDAVFTEERLRSIVAKGGFMQSDADAARG